MPDPARSAIIRRLDETTATRENHGIEEDFLNSRVCYINQITDPPGYSPHEYKASKARRNSELWISAGFFLRISGEGVFSFRTLPQGKERNEKCQKEKSK